MDEITNHKLVRVGAVVDVPVVYRCSACAREFSVSNVDDMVEIYAEHCNQTPDVLQQRRMRFRAKL